MIFFATENPIFLKRQTILFSFYHYFKSKYTFFEKNSVKEVPKLFYDLKTYFTHKGEIYNTT